MRTFAAPSFLIQPVSRRIASQGIVSSIINRFAPLISRVLSGNFHSDMAEPAVTLGTMPVLHFCRNCDDIARLQRNCILALFLIPAAALSI